LGFFCFFVFFLFFFFCLLWHLRAHHLTRRLTSRSCAASTKALTTVRMRWTRSWGVAASIRWLEKVSLSVEDLCVIRSLYQMLVSWCCFFALYFFFYHCRFLWIICLDELDEFYYLLARKSRLCWNEIRYCCLHLISQ
jgi:hypothetical protein